MNFVFDEKLSTKWFDTLAVIPDDQQNVWFIVGDKIYVGVFISEVKRFYKADNSYVELSDVRQWSPLDGDKQLGNYPEEGQIVAALIPGLCCYVTGAFSMNLGQENLCLNGPGILLDQEYNLFELGMDNPLPWESVFEWYSLPLEPLLLLPPVDCNCIPVTITFGSVPEEKGCCDSEECETQKEEEKPVEDNSQPKSAIVASKKNMTESYEDRPMSNRLQETTLSYELTEYGSYQPWGQAKEAWQYIIDNGKFNELDALMEEWYPDGLGETEFNDILAYDPEPVYEALGLRDPYSNEEEDVEFKVYGIDWDADDEEIEDNELPKETTIVVPYYTGEDDEVIDALSDEYGFTVNGVESIERIEESKKSSDKKMKESDDRKFAIYCDNLSGKVLTDASMLSGYVGNYDNYSHIEDLIDAEGEDAPIFDTKEAAQDFIDSDPLIQGYIEEGDANYTVEDVTAELRNDYLMIESIKGNTKQFIQNVEDYLDGFGDDIWENLKLNIQYLQKTSRHGLLNEAIRTYIEGGCLEAYISDVRETLSKLYENTPEEKERWAKYPDDKVWERYVNVMIMYIPKAYKKHTGKDLDIHSMSESKLNERIHKKDYGQGVVGYAEPGEWEHLYYEDYPCGYIADGEVYLFKNCPQKIYDLFGDYKTAHFVYKDKSFGYPDPDNPIECDESKKSDKKRLHEDYGWSVKSGMEWYLLDEMIEAYGAEEMLDALAKAMGTQELGENLAFICRNYDFRSHCLENCDDEEFDESQKKMTEAGYKTSKVKNWYVRKYPTDEMGPDLNGDITFEDIFMGLHTGHDVYELLGVGDSLIRERVFNELAARMHIDYDEIYHMWLGESKKSDNKMTEAKHSDGWPESVVDAFRQVFGDIDKFQYEINRCQRGVYTGATTVGVLAEAAAKIGQEWNEVVEELPYLEDPDEE